MARVSKTILDADGNPFSMPFEDDGSGVLKPVHVSELSGSIVAESSQTESDATGDVLTFSAPITAIEIFHSEGTPQDFVVNGLTVTVAAGGWRSPVGGTPSASVTLPNGVTGVVVTRLE